VTYMFAVFTGIFVLVRIGPWIMRVNLREECQKLENDLGPKKEEPGVVSAYRQFMMRAYTIPEDMDDKTVMELENIFAPEIFCRPT
jgi:putative transport protein